MKGRLIKSILLFALPALISCNANREKGIRDKQEPKTKKEARTNGKVKLELLMPPESYNEEIYDTYTDTTSFIRNAAGKIIFQTFDTITKGGGYRLYDNIDTGLYSYSVKTIFREQITGLLRLMKDTSMCLGPECLYYSVDTLLIDSIVAADSIKIAFTHGYGSDLRQFLLYRRNNQYEVNFFSENAKRPQRWMADSTNTIHAIANVVAVLMGLEKIGADGFDMYSTAFYIKANNTIYIHNQCDEDLFDEAFDRFKEGLLRKKKKPKEPE